MSTPYGSAQPSSQQVVPLVKTCYSAIKHRTPPPFCLKRPLQFLFEAARKTPRTMSPPQSKTTWKSCRLWGVTAQCNVPVHAIQSFHVPNCTGIHSMAESSLEKLAMSAKAESPHNMMHEMRWERWEAHKKIHDTASRTNANDICSVDFERISLSRREQKTNAPYDGMGCVCQCVMIWIMRLHIHCISVCTRRTRIRGRSRRQSTEHTRTRTSTSRVTYWHSLIRADARLTQHCAAQRRAAADSTRLDEETTTSPLCDLLRSDAPKYRKKSSQFQIVDAADRTNCCT